ncbi:MAG: D-alanyl-D-alanine carboxypeptidase/D-alanyl-D-alanine-endopeptidase [Planctomycetes bacterium]|nr:D-alanyl-D-alanine carboxypeptidase/D-alanyl-D-alanine-endopeptidase [Planctomycetota bacterium]
MAIEIRAWRGAALGVIALLLAGRGAAAIDAATEQPAQVAPAAGDEHANRFAAAAAKVLARKELDGASVGIDVRSVTRDAPFFARAADQSFTPASNLKLITLYLAFATLGPAFEWETPLLVDAPVVEGGRVDGNLWVRGSGDPTLQPCFFESEDDGAALQPFVQAVALQGVRQITGDLIVDARAFDNEWIPQGWPKDQLSEKYAAPVAALALNGNRFRVRVFERGDGGFGAELRPAVDGWSVAPDLARSGNRDGFLVSLLSPDARGAVHVRGSVGADVGVAHVETTVENPPDYFGRALRAALAKAGIAIAGRVRPPLADEKLSEPARTLYTRRSPLLPALQLCGKESDNQIAEQVLKSCAFVRFGLGSAANGARLVQELARQCDVEPEKIRIVDGSGLSRDDLVTPRLLAAVLARAYAAPWRDDYVRCLPISGVDGTLDRRMNEPAMQYRVRAKTGYIARVSALSGFAMAGAGEAIGGAAAAEVFAFSILINGFKGGNAEMKKVQDDLCRALIGGRSK